MYRNETNSTAKKKILDSIANIATKKTNSMKHERWYYERHPHIEQLEKDLEIDIQHEIDLENLI